MFQAGVNVSGRYRKWPVFSRPLMAGFGCPPRPGEGGIDPGTAGMYPRTASERPGRPRYCPAHAGMDPTTTPSTWPRPVHLARVGIEPEPSSGEARFVGEPTRGEQRHGQTDRFAVLCRRAVTASRRRPACRGTTAH